MTLLIFDCDGTLIESEMLHAQVEVDLLRERFGYSSTAEEHNRRFAGIGMRAIYDLVGQETGRTVPPTFDNDLAQRKKRAFVGQIHPIPHVAEALQALKALPRCIGSNAHAEVLGECLAAAGLYDWFAPHIFSAGMVAHPKPAPDLFLYAAQKMNATPEDCIVIEDSSHGVAAARAAGMRVLGFAGGGHCFPGYEERLREADAIFADMRDLPGLVSSLRDTRQGTV